MQVERAMEVRDQEQFLVTLAHDEFIGSIIAGKQEDYKDWTKFIGECLVKLRLPEQREPQE